MLFEETEKVSKYASEIDTGEDLLTPVPDGVPNGVEPAVKGLRNKMRDLAMRRQQGSGVLKTASWALYNRAQLKNLIENITALFGEVERIFPAPETRLALVRQEAVEIQDREALKLLESAAQNIDSLLQAAAKEVLTGHHYLNIVVKGKAQLGDIFICDWKGKAKGTSHKYDGVEVDTNAHALIGNQYGGEGFWKS